MFETSKIYSKVIRDSLKNLENYSERLIEAINLDVDYVKTEPVGAPSWLKDSLLNQYVSNQAVKLLLENNIEEKDRLGFIKGIIAVCEAYTKNSLSGDADDQVCFMNRLCKNAEEFVELQKIFSKNS